MPLEGILLRMPDGTGVRFSVNGAELTVVGSALMQNEPNNAMSVTMLQGSAQITSNGQTRTFSAGQEVVVPMGGADGMQASGPPSVPTTPLQNLANFACAAMGLNCGQPVISTISP